jgi:hypothetical protein
MSARVTVAAAIMVSSAQVTSLPGMPTVTTNPSGPWPALGLACPKIRNASL